MTIMHAKTMMATAVVAAALATAGPAAAQTFLDQLVAKALGAKRTASGDAGTGGASPAAALAAITPAQSAAIDRLLAAPVQTPGVAAARADAAPLLRALIATGSCARSGRAFDALSRQMLTPESLGGYIYNVMVKTQYHDGATCLDVVRLIARRWKRRTIDRRS